MLLYLQSVSGSFCDVIISLPQENLQTSAIISSQGNMGSDNRVLGFALSHKVDNTSNRVFPKLTDLTFLSFLYKINITGFENQQKKIVSTGYWTHNTNPIIRIPATLPIQPQRHLLYRRFMNWTWIISGSIEPDFIRVWKFETGMDWQIGWVGKVAGNLIVGLVLWVQYPVEAIFFADFETPWCQFCTRMTEMSDLSI